MATANLGRSLRSHPSNESLYQPPSRETSYGPYSGGSSTPVPRSRSSTPSYQLSEATVENTPYQADTVATPQYQVKRRPLPVGTYNFTSGTFHDAANRLPEIETQPSVSITQHAGDLLSATSQQQLRIAMEELKGTPYGHIIRTMMTIDRNLVHTRHTPQQLINSLMNDLINLFKQIKKEEHQLNGHTGTINAIGEKLTALARPHAAVQISADDPLYQHVDTLIEALESERTLKSYAATLDTIRLILTRLSVPANLLSRER